MRRFPIGLVFIFIVGYLGPVKAVSLKKIERKCLKQSRKLDNSMFFYFEPRGEYVVWGNSNDNVVLVHGGRIKRKRIILPQSSDGFNMSQSKSKFIRLIEECEALDADVFGFVDEAGKVDSYSISSRRFLSKAESEGWFRELIKYLKSKGISTQVGD